MKFWIFCPLLYLLFLAAGLALPLVALWDRALLEWSDIGIYGLIGVAMIVATIILCLMISRLQFPKYWWMGQVEGKDVFQFDGVYFTGLRINRVPNRLQRIVFGVDDELRRWDITFGMMVVVLLVPHILGAFSITRTYEAYVPLRVRIPETLHQAVLSSLPVMREHGAAWPAGPALQRQLMAEYEKLKEANKKADADYFRMAQLDLLFAFRERRNIHDPFRYTPEDRVYFDRTRGAKGVSLLNVILKKPELERAPWTSSALALIGFFHLSDHNYPRAESFLERALARAGTGANSPISPYQIKLMQAQARMLQGQPAEADALLQSILVDERLPRRAYALAMEHLAETMRMRGERDRGADLLQKAQELYKVLEDKGGLARVNLRLAALAVDEGRGADARRFLSQASSLAHGQDDWFTVNMVGLLTRYLSQTG